MVDIDNSNDLGLTVDIPEPNVNVQVFGEGSIGDAFGGFLSSIVGGFNAFMRKVISSETTLKALVHLTALTIIVLSLILAYRTIGRGSTSSV
jgi:hypothetical protein